MPGLVPGIHVFTTRKTWMAGINPAMTRELRPHASHDLPNRNPDRTGRDPDVVAACRAHRGHGKDSRLPTGGDDVCDRRAGGLPDINRPRPGHRRLAPAAARMDRRRRWSLRLSRALFSRAAVCASGRSRAFELSLAAIDRSVF